MHSGDRRAHIMVTATSYQKTEVNLFRDIVFVPSRDRLLPRSTTEDHQAAWELLPVLCFHCRLHAPQDEVGSGMCQLQPLA